VLFQGEVFAQEAGDQEFGIKVPMTLARKFGASNYSAFRRFVITNSCACCVVVLDQSVHHINGGFTAEVRRVVMSKSFETIYDGKTLCTAVTPSHPLAEALPASGKRMSFGREIVLRDRNREDRVCLVEAFDTKHQVLVLVRDVGPRTRSGIVIPAARSR
jgi:hypothetical protein